MFVKNGMGLPKVTTLVANRQILFDRIFYDVEHMQKIKMTLIAIGE